MGLIQVRVDDGAMERYIRQRLGALANQTPKVLKDSLNATARTARKQIIDDTKKRYSAYGNNDISATPGKIMRLKGATASRHSARLRAVGSPQDLAKFAVSPRRESRGLDRPESYGAKVLSGSGLRRMDRRPKAFLVKFSNGHISLVSRKSDAPGERKLKTYYSPALPQMLGNREIQEQTRKLVGELLPEMMEKQIAKTLKKGAGAK